MYRNYRNQPKEPIINYHNVGSSRVWNTGENKNYCFESTRFKVDKTLAAESVWSRFQENQFRNFTTLANGLDKCGYLAIISEVTVCELAPVADEPPQRIKSEMTYGEYKRRQQMDWNKGEQDKREESHWGEKNSFGDEEAGKKRRYNSSFEDRRDQRDSSLKRNCAKKENTGWSDEETEKPSNEQKKSFNDTSDGWDDNEPATHAASSSSKVQEKKVSTSIKDEEMWD